MEVACALLSGGAKVDMQDINGLTPLYEACSGGHIVVVHALLSAGAEVDLQRNHGGSPLHMACQEGRTEVVHAQRVCSMCGGPPWASASFHGVAKLKACGHCMSVLLLTRVSEEALEGGRPQGGLPTAAGEVGEEEGREG